jgi:hypothetical protein
MSKPPDANDILRNRGDDQLRRIFDSPPADEEPQPRDARASSQFKFPLIPFGQLKVETSGAYVVKDLIPRTGLVVIWGPPKCGKSFLNLDMMLHVALGWNYRGHRVKQGTVVYCALEGQAGFGARKEAFCARHRQESADAPLYLMFTPLNLVKHAVELIHCIVAQLPPGETPIAVVIDTLNRSLAGSESKDEDMTAYIRAADVIRDKFNCVVIIIHHCGVDGTRPRGHTSLAGADDVQIAVKRDPASNVLLTVEHMKDGPEGETIASKLEVIDVGLDDDGDRITSCVVVPAEAAAARKTSAPRPKSQQIALRALSEAILDLGAPAEASANVPPGVSTVHVDEWRQRAYRMGISPSGPAASQKAFNRAYTELLKHNHT